MGKINKKKKTKKKQKDLIEVIEIPQIVSVFGKNHLITNGCDGEELSGKLKIKEAIIEIKSDLKGDDFISTLVHELLHAVQFRTSQHQAVPIEFLEINTDTIATFITETFDLKFKNSIHEYSKEACKKLGV